MITINLSRAFFILMCSYALFSTFRGILRADCIEQYNLWKGSFQVASLPVFLTSPAKSYREDAGNGGYGFPSISGARISNICRCHRLVAAHYPLIFLDRVLSWSRAWTLDLRRSTSWTNQMALFESLLKFSYAFYPHRRHWHTRYNWHLGCSHLPQTTQSSFDEIRE